MGEQETPETQALAEQSPPPSAPPAPPGTSQFPPGAFPPSRHHGRGNWVVAVIIIVVGIVFLVKNTGWLGNNWNFANWWALFILIPAIGSFADAWKAYTTSGRRLSAKVARPFAFGLLFVAITVIFLLQLDWGKVWPVLLIIVGLGMIFGWRRD